MQKINSTQHQRIIFNCLEIQPQLSSFDIQKLFRIEYQRMLSLFVDSDFKVSDNSSDCSLRLHKSELHSKTDARTIAKCQELSFVPESFHATMLSIELLRDETVGCFVVLCEREIIYCDNENLFVCNLTPGLR